MEQTTQYVAYYTRQLPGWDEFGKTESGHILVDAHSEAEAEKIADERLGKYCVVTSVMVAV